MKSAEVLRTIGAIVRLPLVGEYKVGVTGNPEKRRREYRGVGFQHYVILTSGLSAEAALRIEEDLYERLRADHRSTTYTKFRLQYRDDRYRSSLGGRRIGCKGEDCVYIAWIER